MRSSCLLSALIAWGPLGATALAAEPVSAQALAKPLYEEGVALFRARQFAEAAKKFQAAYNRDQSPTLLYNLARAHEEMGDPAGAAEHYETFLQRFPNAPDAADVRLRLAANQANARGLAPGFLTVGGVPEGATVFIDDQQIAPGPDGRWSLDKGRHAVRVERPGFQPWRETVEIGPNAAASLTYEGTEPLPAVPPPEPGIGWISVVGWSTVGAGAALGIGGLLLHGAANKDKTTYEDAATRLEGRRVTEADAATLRQSAADYETKRKGALGLYLLGAVVAGAGFTLMLFDEPDAPQGGVQVGAGPQGLWLTGTF
jgi:tetratricopeptide (TPR) repeat protein